MISTLNVPKLQHPFVIFICVNVKKIIFIHE